MTAAFGASESVATQLANGWRVELVLDSDRERDILPDQPFVGYGSTKNDAAMEAMRAYLRAVNTLSEEQRLGITKDLPDDSRLVGASRDEDYWLGDDEDKARAWADDVQQRENPWGEK